jgi:hypothetical protein
MSVTNEVWFKKIYQTIWKTKFNKFLNKNRVVYAVKDFAEVCLSYINLAIIIKTLRKKLTETSKIILRCIKSLLGKVIDVLIEDHLKNFR